MPMYATRGSSIKDLLAYKEAYFGKKALKPKKAPKMLFPTGIEREYMRSLNKMTDSLIQKTNEILLPELPKIIDEANFYKNQKADSYSDMIVDTFKKLRFEFGNTYTDRDIQELADKIADSTQEFHRKDLIRVLSTIAGIDVYIADPWIKEEMKAFVESNISLIRSIPNKYFSDLEEITFRNIRQGQTTDTLREELTSRYDVVKNRADLIARDQMGKYYGQLNQLRQTNLGIDKYIWRTAGDNRVRPTHWQKEGQIFSWNKPPFDTGHPGEDFQCRCWAEPILDQFFDIGTEFQTKNLTIPNVPTELQGLAKEAIKMNKKEFITKYKPEAIVDLSSRDKRFGRIFGDYGKETYNPLPKEELQVVAKKYKYVYEKDLPEKINENTKMTMYRGITGKGKIEAGDFVTPFKEYAEGYAKNPLVKLQEGKPKILKFQTEAKNLVFTGGDLREFIYSPRSIRKKYKSLENFYDTIKKRGVKI